MGGLSVYYLTLTHRHLFKGAIMMAPALKNWIPWYSKVMIRVLKNVLPEHTQFGSAAPKYSYRNPAIIDFLMADPFVYKEKNLLATWYTLGDTMDHVPHTFKTYKCPFLVIQGGIDKLVHPMGGFELYEQSPL